MSPPAKVQEQTVPSISISAKAVNAAPFVPGARPVAAPVPTNVKQQAVGSTAPSAVASGGTPTGTPTAGSQLEPKARPFVPGKTANSGANGGALVQASNGSTPAAAAAAAPAVAAGPASKAVNAAPFVPKTQQAQQHTPTAADKRPLTGRPGDSSAAEEAAVSSLTPPASGRPQPNAPPTSSRGSSGGRGGRVGHISSGGGVGTPPPPPHHSPHAPGPPQAVTGGLHSVHSSPHASLARPNNFSGGGAGGPPPPLQHWSGGGGGGGSGHFYGGRGGGGPSAMGGSRGGGRGPPDLGSNPSLNSSLSLGGASGGLLGGGGGMSGGRGGGNIGVGGGYGGRGRGGGAMAGGIAGGGLHAPMGSTGHVMGPMSHHAMSHHSGSNGPGGNSPLPHQQHLQQHRPGMLSHHAQQQQHSGGHHAAGGFGAPMNHLGHLGHLHAGGGVSSSIPQVRPHEQYLLSNGRGQLQMYFLGETLRQQLQQRSYLVHARAPGEGEEGGLPARIHHFHTLYPLEDISPDAEAMSHALGLRTALIKGISAMDGQPYALRRVDAQQVIPTAELLAQAQEVAAAWAPIANHPNLVGLRSAFVSSELDGTPALFFVHDLHPRALTLAQAHLQPTATAAGLVVAQTPSEEVLWGMMVQLTAAMRAVHSAGLALRPGCLHPSKVLLTGFGRVRINCVGILDALSGDLHAEFEDIAYLHRQDLTALGQLILTLACSGICPAPSLDVCAAHYSPELTRILAALLASVEGGPLGSWRQLAGALADRSLAELEATAVMGDTLVSELSRECENGRLLRLLVKLGHINERPDDDTGSGWSETGDRYLLKLFRDFVFHQSSEEGTPLLEFGHVVEALNKLDAGVPEEILLLSRDEASMLVVSYADIARCLEGAYSELGGRATRQGR